MPGLSFSNELISQDKGLHCNFACLLYSKIVNPLPESWIVEIINSTIKIEMEFVADALPVELIGMNSVMMCNYLKFCADRLLISLGCHRHFKVGNPFEWMEMIGLQGKTNFFEKRVGAYSKSGVGADRADQFFALDASFWWEWTNTHTNAQCTDQKICFSTTPPLSQCFCFRGFAKTNTTNMWTEVTIESNVFFRGRRLSLPHPNAPSP